MNLMDTVSKLRDDIIDVVQAVDPSLIVADNFQVYWVQPTNRINYSNFMVLERSYATNNAADNIPAYKLNYRFKCQIFERNDPWMADELMKKIPMSSFSTQALTEGYFVTTIFIYR